MQDLLGGRDWLWKFSESGRDARLFRLRTLARRTRFCPGDDGLPHIGVLRVALDAQLALGTATGIGEYVAGLRDALRASGADVVALACARVDPWRFDRRVLWDQALLPLAAARSRADILHCASGTMPLVAPLPIVATVHDVAWLRVQGHARRYARAYFGAFSLARYRGARRIVVDSAFSRGELLAVAPLDPAHVDVVYPGVAADVMRVERARDALAPFALCVGTLEARKNFEVLVRALVGLPGLRLVSVGPATPYRERCLQLAHELGVVERVEIRGYVARATLLELYARAAVVAMPSRYEGFGYGAAQALCAGVPLVCSNASSLPEVVGADAALVAPGDVTGWQVALARVLAEPHAAEAGAATARASARERFAWAAAAQRLMRVYERALDQH